jgi:hypothetical protein
MFRGIVPNIPQKGKNPERKINTYSESKLAATGSLIHDANNELPLINFVVAIKKLALTADCWLMYRSVAISANVTPPKNMIMTVRLPVQQETHAVKVVNMLCSGLQPSTGGLPPSMHHE